MASRATIRSRINRTWNHGFFTIPVFRWRPTFLLGLVIWIVAAILTASRFQFPFASTSCPSNCPVSFTSFGSLCIGSGIHGGFKEQLELFKLVRTTNHFIVCGLGEKGLLLTKDLRRANYRVVVIEQDNSNPQLEICRELGAITIIGDARDGKILLKAGIREARQVIAVCSEDGTNVDIAKQAEFLLHRKQGKILPCTVHIMDPYLWTILREREFTKEQTSSIRVEMFNIYDTGARLLLHETLNLSDGDRKPHLLIIGIGNFAEYLIVHAAREWCLLNEQLEQD